jgi:C-terminal processing protease CtpA/Prc
VPLVPVQWTFTTLPEKTRPAAEQKQRNKQALALLMKELPARYSYYDLRVKDWGKLEKENTPAILAARTDRAFASAVGEMLRATEDIHVWLKLGDQTFAGGRRSVDSLYRREQIERHVRTAPVGTQAAAGRTGDAIGYLMIAGWTNEVDPEAIGRAIKELADTKAMVIDVRPNCGGDEGLAQKVAAWFVDGTKTYAKNRIRVRAGKDGFSEVYERKITGNPQEQRYDKPIAVLTSRYVMSSNESFVMMLQQAKDCTVVGQPTFGCSGNPKPCELSNGVTVYLSSWQDLRLDGTPFEGEGLKPDVEVACTAQDLESGDPILAKALELLRTKVAAK